MTLEGKLIEYLDNDSFICGVVTAVSNNRLRLLNQQNREVNIPVARIIHSSETGLFLPGQAAAVDKESLLKQINAVSARRSLLMKSIDLEGIWKLSTNDNETACDAPYLVELLLGDKVDDDQTAAFIRSVFKDRILFKYKNGKILVRPPLKVEQLRKQKDEEQGKKIFLDQGAKVLVQAWQNKEPGDRQTLDACIRLVKDYYLFGKEDKESDLARDLLKKARLNGPHDGYHLLVKLGVWEKNENIPLLRQEIPTDFNNETMAYAENIVAAEPETLLSGKRKDLRHHEVLTIDGARTRDFDDALHLEKCGDNFQVGVHISDVAHYIKPGDILFKEAQRRVSSIYFSEALVPMLPKNLSENVFSLVLGKDRPALSFIILLSPAGDVLDFKILSSLIKVKRRLTYQESDQLIPTDSDLGILYRLAENLRQKRLDEGALLLPFPDLNIHIRNNDQVEVSLSESDSPGRLLISEFMILVNTLTARFMTEREIPGLFKSQPPPRHRLVHGLSKDLFTNTLQRKKLSPMSLLTIPKPHIGVGSPYYTTISSPIRRLHDLIMQLQINNYIVGKGLLFSRQDLKNFCFIISSTMKRINAPRQLRQRYWLLKHLEARIGEQLDALVIEQGQRVHVLLVDLMMDADLPINPAADIRPGQMVSVRIAKADALNNQLRLEW